MSMAAIFARRRAHSRQHIETFVSVEKAAHLQDVSMKKFRADAASELELRRMIGHVSVNRRSTEIIKTATFEEDILREMMEEELFGCDENASWINVGAPHTVPEPEPPVPPVPEATLVHDTMPMIKPSSTTDRLVTIYDSHLDMLPQCQSDLTARSTSAEEEMIRSMDEDWMYNVQNLHIDYTALIQPNSSSHLSQNVTIQLRQIIQSLASLAKRNSYDQSTFDIGALEAYGSPEQDQLFGLGLHCSFDHYSQCNSRVQLTI